MTDHSHQRELNRVILGVSDLSSNVFVFVSYKHKHTTKTYNGQAYFVVNKHTASSYICLVRLVWWLAINCIENNVNIVKGLNLFDWGTPRLAAIYEITE
jgi:hypothetical protein